MVLGPSGLEHGPMQVQLQPMEQQWQAKNYPYWAWRGIRLNSGNETNNTNHQPESAAV